MIDQAKIRRKPAAILTGHQHFYDRITPYLALLHRNIDLLTLLTYYTLNFIFYKSF